MKKKVLLAIMITLVVWLSGCTFLSEQFASPVERSFQSRMMETKEMLRRSNVGVEVTLVDNDGIFGREHVKQGSGVIFVTQAGYHYLLTNFHVVDEEDYESVSYKVSPSVSDESLEAELVETCSLRDLAIMRFSAEDADEEITAIDIESRKDDSLRRGEFVFATGNPHTLEGLVTFGEFLGMSDVDEVDFPVIRHNAAIFTGSSGGALADIDGNLVGINTWAAEAEGVYLAVPLSEIRDWLAELDIFRTELLRTENTMNEGGLMR